MWTDLLGEVVVGVLAGVAWCYTLMALAPSQLDAQGIKGQTGAMLISAACVAVLVAWGVA